MGIFGPDKPKQPNPNKVANKQLGFGKKAAIFSQTLGAVPQTVPGGSVNYKVNKRGRLKGVTVKYDKANQEYYDQAGATRNQFLDQLPQDAFNFAPDEARVGAVRDATYKRRVGMVEPQLKEAADRSTLQLTERGIPIGSEIYGDENQRLAQERENAYTSIAGDAELAAGQESDRQLAAALTQRNQPFNEFASVISAAPMTNPSFQPQPGYSVGQPNYAEGVSDAYKADMDAFNSGRSGLWNGLFDLGSAGLSRIGAGRR